jgi:DNA end-binding protein Ku
MAATIWKGHLTFGLVSIPIKLVRAARSEKVSLRQLHRVYAKAQQSIHPVATRGRNAQVQSESMVTPVRQQFVAGDEDEPIPRTEVVKGYEYEPDRYVVLEDNELKSLAPESARNMQILEFVKLTEIDPIYFESSYYVLPDKGGEKAYALLLEALRKTGYVALAEFAMHRREHIVIIRPGRRGIILHTMYYPSEIRSEDEYTADVSGIGRKEMDMAKLLIESMAAKFEPEKYTDKYRQKLEALISAKIAGHEVAAAPAEPDRPETVDIVKALEQSLALIRKPVQSTSTAKKRPTHRRAV